MKNIKKNLLIAFLIMVLCIIYSYVCAIDNIPSNIILFDGEKLNIKTICGISLDDHSSYTSIQTSTITKSDFESTNKRKIEVRLFDKFKVKEVGVNVIERTKVVPVGKIAGLKLYTNGVLVVGMSEIKGVDNERYKPYENSGIEEGDIIIEVQDIQIKDINELIDIVNSSNGENIKIKYLHNNEYLETRIQPIKTGHSEYKLGFWVRDSAAGIGTMTFYDPNSKCFAALGHGITDIDTGELLDISNGEFITTKVLSIIKGKEGTPGKIQGSISDQVKIGTIYKNTGLGVYGTITDINIAKIDLSKEIEVASRNEINLGKASIICSLDEEDPKEYEIQIEKLYLNNDIDNKSMFIKVTDDELIRKTGGIIQGMSGCPIIQNGKFIGAVTNVLVNNPTKGYGIFADLMLNEISIND